MNKLQSRSSQCIFLGYALRYKRAICYDLQNKILILSRHIIYDEEVFPCKKSGIQESNVSSVLQNTRHVPIVIQLPIPTVTSSVELSNNYVHRETYSKAISCTAT